MKRKNPRQGRPVLPPEEKQSIIVVVKYSPAKYADLMEKVVNSGMRRAEYIREMSLRGKVINRFSKEEMELLRLLSNETNNLNQIAKACNSGQTALLKWRIEETLNRLNNLLDRFKNKP